MADIVTEKPVRRRIYLVRHGDVSYFDSEGKPVRPDTVPLNPEGRSQAELLAGELASIEFDRVVSSDLDRCVQTATILLAGRQVPLERRAELREVRPGRLADLPPESVKELVLGALSHQLTRESRFLGGETFGSMIDRVLGCVNELIGDASWRRLLIVAHGGVNRAIIAHALGLGVECFGSLEQDAACLNLLELDTGGRWLVRLMNHTAHDPAKHRLNHTTMEAIYQQYLAGQRAT